MVSSPSRFAALAVFLTVLPASALLAMHEANHRYDVAGYILSADDQAISGVTVAGHVDGKPMGSGRSDTDGYYRFTMHLHDTDVGRELRLKTADYQGTVRLTMTPRDTRTLRLHHVNFIAGKLVEGELPGRGRISQAVIVAAAGTVILLVSYFATRHFRRIRRRRQRAERKAVKAQAQSPSKRRKRKKRRR